MFQPTGIEVSGNVGIRMALPQVQGSHEYVSEIGDRVLLVGYDPDAGQIVPVGVAAVDAETKTVVSDGIIHLKRLDYLGLSFVPEEHQPFLEAYVNGEINLLEMIAELEAE